MLRRVHEHSSTGGRMTRFKPYLALVAALVAAAGCDRQPTAVRTPGPAHATVAPVARVHLVVLSTAYCAGGTCGYNYRYDANLSTDADGTVVSYAWIENGVTVS